MAITRIEVDQVPAHLPELVDEVPRSGEVVITRDDEPVAMLVGCPQAAQRRPFGTAKGLITIAEDFDEPLEEFEEYMR